MSEDISPGPSELAGHSSASYEATVERPTAIPEVTPRVSEVKLPSFNHAPRALEPVEADPAYQEALRALEPVRAERDQLRERLAFLRGQVRLDPRTGDYAIPYQQVREYQIEMQDGQQRLPELEATYRQHFDPQVRPILERRLTAAATLPHYTWPQAEAELGTGPAIAMDDRVQYGLCDIDVDRIVATDGPGEFEWSGSRTSKEGEGSSADIIVGYALTMLAGDYAPEKAIRGIRAKVALTGDGTYTYFLEDGRHRVGAAKLIGQPVIAADVESYNYSAGDVAAQEVDANQRSRAVTVDSAR